MREKSIPEEPTMSPNPISSSPQHVAPDRLVRRPGGTGDHTGPPAPSPSNGMPPPVGDVVVVSDLARAYFDAWESRQAWSGFERRTPGATPSQTAAEGASGAPQRAPEAP
jgi:hypothetical protein